MRVSAKSLPISDLKPQWSLMASPSVVEGMRVSYPGELVLLIDDA